MTTVISTPTVADDFNDKVQFFIALQQHDTARLKALLEAHPHLMDARTEWGVLPNSNYWPLGYTALHWAAATDDEPLLDLLLDSILRLDADVNVRTKNWRATTLHIAAMTRRPAMTKKLPPGIEKLLQPIVTFRIDLNRRVSNMQPKRSSFLCFLITTSLELLEFPRILLSKEKLFSRNWNTKSELLKILQKLLSTPIPIKLLRP